MSTATASQQSTRIPDAPAIGDGPEPGQHGRRNNNNNRRRKPAAAAQGSDIMPGDGAYILQQQQQQQPRNRGPKRGNQTANNVSESVPPPTQTSSQRNGPVNTIPNGTAGENNGERSQGNRRSRNPRHRNRPAQANGDAQGSQPLSRVPTNGSTAGSTTSNPAAAGVGRSSSQNRQGVQRNRAFNNQMTENTSSPEALLDPSADSFVPGERGQRNRNNNQARRNQPNLEQPPHLAASASSMQYQVQDQQNQARSQIQPQAANRRNARARKPFQGNLTSQSDQFEEMQERAVMGSIPAVERKYRGWGGMKDEEDGLVSRLVRGLGGVGGNWLECVIVSTAIPNSTNRLRASLIRVCLLVLLNDFAPSIRLVLFTYHIGRYSRRGSIWSMLLHAFPPVMHKRLVVSFPSRG